MVTAIAITLIICFTFTLNLCIVGFSTRSQLRTPIV